MRIVVFALVALVACVPAPPTGGRDQGLPLIDDAGSTPDVGFAPDDAGITPDAGITSDAGLAADTGLAPEDAGITPGDAGIVPDAGFAPEDAGFAPDARGPRVDRSSPQLYSFRFTPSSVDPAASQHDAEQPAYLDTRVAPVGKLVVYLHGAGAPATCGSPTHQQVLAGLGFHTIGPCYVADYGVGNCGADIGGCRLEAIEGIDHSAVITIPPPDSLERRVVRMLEQLRTQNPEGDWGYYLDGNLPRWPAIIISGISHGASSAGVVGMARSVSRVVMLSGPLDTGQAWLSGTPVTPIDRFWGFTHTLDDQHAGHLAAFEAMHLPGAPVDVDTVAPPYQGSHRLSSSFATTDGHSSTQAGGPSPQQGGDYVYLPVWTLMYGP